MVTVPARMIKNVARAMIGIPYKNFGRTTQGLDCLGMCIEFFSRFGLKINDSIIDGLAWVEHCDNVRKGGLADLLKTNKPEIGGIVAIRSNSTVPNHLAVVIDDTYILNSSQPVGIHFLRMFVVRQNIECFMKHPQLEVIDDPRY